MGRYTLAITLKKLAIKLGCDDHCTTINVINSWSNIKINKDINLILGKYICFNKKMSKFKKTKNNILEFHGGSAG